MKQMDRFRIWHVVLVGYVLMAGYLCKDTVVFRFQCTFFCDVQKAFCDFNLVLGPGRVSEISPHILCFLNNFNYILYVIK